MDRQADSVNTNNLLASIELNYIAACLAWNENILVLHWVQWNPCARDGIVWHSIIKLYQQWR